MKFIYGLWCPVEGVLRYIGKADEPRRRLRQHIRNAVSGKTTHHCARWLMKLRAQGRSPELRTLCALPDHANWQAVERLLIGFARHADLPLTNITIGGEGSGTLDQEYAARKAAKMREVGARPEFRATVSAATKSALAEPGVKSRHKAGVKAAWSKPEVRAAMVAGLAAPEARQAMSAGAASVWADPAKAEKQRAAQRAGWADPKKKAAALAGRKAMWADPVQRAALIEKQKAAWVKRKEAKA